MLALLSETPGGPATLRLRDVEPPTPADGEVLIDVMAVGVNFPDTLVIEDRYQFRPERPFAPGAEVAGIVSAVGPSVAGLAPGDRVFAGTGFGGMAEQALAPARRCHRMPAGMPFDTAAALLMTYGTSHHALRDRARLAPGETVLVLGAAGGVGLAAVELAKAFGARAIAAVSSEEKAEITRQHGADETLVYPSGALDHVAARQFNAAIRAVAPDGVDVIYDAVGGDYAEPALRTMAWDGRYLIIGFPAGIPRIPLNLPLLKGCAMLGVFWGEFVERSPEQFAVSVAELVALHAGGAIRPRISERFPLVRGGEAIARLSARAATGKVVVTMPAFDRQAMAQGSAPFQQEVQP